VNVTFFQPNAAAAAGGWGDPAAQWPPAGIDTTRLKAPPTATWNDDWNSRKVVSSSAILNCIVTVIFVLKSREWIGY